VRQNLLVKKGTELKNIRYIVHPQPIVNVKVLRKISGGADKLVYSTSMPPGGGRRAVIWQKWFNSCSESKDLK
jgi:hypothetical protein